LIPNQENIHIPFKIDFNVGLEHYPLKCNEKQEPTLG
jgi:hypothetical protein